MRHAKPAGMGTLHGVSIAAGAIYLIDEDDACSVISSGLAFVGPKARSQVASHAMLLFHLQERGCWVLGEHGREHVGRAQLQQQAVRLQRRLRHRGA